MSEIRDVAPRVGEGIQPSRAEMDEFLDLVLGQGAGDLSGGRWDRDELRAFAESVLARWPCTIPRHAKGGGG